MNIMAKLTRKQKSKTRREVDLDLGVKPPKSIIFTSKKIYNRKKKHKNTNWIRLLMDNINMKTIKFNKDKTVLLNGKRILTRIISLKGESWRDYPTFYKINGFYYV